MTSSTVDEASLTIRQPRSTDGMAVHSLVQACPPLDTNSAYCNLLQCSYFAETAAVAEYDGELVGMTTGFIKPTDPNTLFLWQMAVSDKARGLKLAQRLIMTILDRPCCESVKYIETTITASNKASWAVFRKIADKLGTELNESVCFDRQEHFHDKHDSEHLARIGPFSISSLA